MVPSGPSPSSGLGLGRTRSSRLPEYVRRLGSYAAMDTDFALWQMVHLVWAPSRVWRMAKFHRQTKGQWARDGTWLGGWPTGERRACRFGWCLG